LFEIIGADEQDDRFRMQKEHVFLQADENTPGGVATDTAVGDRHAWKPGAEIFTPSLRDRIAEQHHRVAILFDTRGPRRAAIRPEFAKPILTANRPGARQAIVGGGNLQLGGFVLRGWSGANDQKR
jgi:hypothetical protein